MTFGTRWIFLSPHLDDAVLSCGGMIAEIAKTAHVEIWSIFTRAPLRGPYSHAAQWLHSISGGHTGSRLAALRRAEDRAACKVVGASAVHLPFVEALYRRRSDGRFLYRHALQGSIHPSDRALIEKIANELKKSLRPGDRVVAPLAIAGHADHLVTREAVHSVIDKGLVYYVEIPYLEGREEKVAALTASMWNLRFLPSAESLDRWVHGAHKYKSQVPMLHGASGSIEDVIRRYAGTGKVTLFTPSEQLARSVGRHESFSMSSPAEPENVA